MNTIKTVDRRKIIRYPEAGLRDLDTGTVVGYPLPAGGHAYYAVPGFLIIGAQKCGTRELHTWLTMHPKLKAPVEECHFFDEVMDVEVEWNRYIFNRAFLISKHKKRCNSDTVTFEKTPAYFDRTNRGVPVPGLIRKMMPSGKFIVMLRNPAERAYSAYQMGRNPKELFGSIYANIDFLSLVKARLSATASNPGERLLHIGRYALHLENWFRYFSQDQFLVLFLEDFKRDPFTVMDKVLAFLALPGFDYRSQAEKNARGLWVLKTRPSKGNALPYEPMPDAARALLEEHYAPWNEKLRQLLPKLTIPW